MNNIGLDINFIFRITSKIFSVFSKILVILLSILIIAFPVILSNFKVNETSIIFFEKEYKVRYFNKKIILISDNKKIKTNFTKEFRDNIYEMQNNYDNKKVIFYTEFCLVIITLSYLILLKLFKNINKVLENESFFEKENIDLMCKVGILLSIFLIFNLISSFILNIVLKSKININFSIYKYISIYVSIFYVYEFKNAFNAYTKEKLCKK